MKKALVTGANGFIGKALCRRLSDEKTEVIRFKGDICDARSFESLYKKGITHCFHLAAKTFVPESWKHPETFIKTNVQGTQNVLDLCRKENISLTYVSAYLYGIPEEIPISEEAFVRPNNPYALSKYLAEQLCFFYTSRYNIPITIMRPFNAYGPGQNEKFLIPSIIRQCLNQSEIRVKNLSPRRDYIYIDDLIDALMASFLSSGKKTCSVYNIASGTSYSVEEVITFIQRAAGTNKKIVSENTERTNEIPDTAGNAERIKNDLTWHPRHSFMEGISKIFSSGKLVKTNDCKT